MEVSVPFTVVLQAEMYLSSMIALELDDFYRRRVSGQNMRDVDSLHYSVGEAQAIYESLRRAYDENFDLVGQREKWKQIEEIGLSAFVAQRRDRSST